MHYKVNANFRKVMFTDIFLPVWCMFIRVFFKANLMFVCHNIFLKEPLLFTKQKVIQQQNSRFNTGG